MNDLTIIIVSRNDEDVLPYALSTCDGFGKVVVVDSSTSSKTEGICRKFKVKYVKNTFRDFADQRNFGMYYATTKWVLYLDSDEKLTENFKHEIASIIKNHEDSEVAGYYIRRKTFYYGRDWGFSDKVQRLFLRSKFIEWYGVVHETPKVKGSIAQVESPILHFTHRNLSQMVGKTNDWSIYEAKLRFSANHPALEPWRFFRVMGSEFLSSYIKNKGYKNGTYGLIEAMYQSFSIFITYAKLWEMQIQEGKKS